MIKTRLPLLLLAFGCNSDSDINKVGGRNGGGDGRDTGTEEEVDWTLSVELTPTEVYTNDTVTAVASTDGTDDSPTIRYAFSVDDAVAQDGDTTTLDGTTHFSKGQSITVTASSGSQNATSEPVVVLNTPPTAPVVSMLRTAADAACDEGWFITPDGDSCAAPFFNDFSWYAADEHCLSLGGHLMNSESEAEDAFIQSHILPDTYLWIGLNDLDIEGYWGWTTGEEMAYTGWDPASSQPDSGATVPGTPDEDCVLMTMSGWHDYVCTSAVDYNGHICEVYAPQSLVCSIDEDSVDADDDAITYTFEWTANGTPFTAARTTVHPGDTVPNITGSEGEVWVCTVTPNDGEVDGESATAEYGEEAEEEVEPCYGNERACPGLSCLDILESGFSTGDGDYWIDPDASGAFEVYCDMSWADGGWTLLFSSTGDSTLFGYASPAWTDTGTATSAPAIVDGSDYHSVAYGRMPTNEIRISFSDLSSGYVMDHGQAIPLQTFYTEDRTHIEYAYGVERYTDTGAASMLSDYLAETGSTSSGGSCTFLGINEKEYRNTKLGMV